MRVEVGVLGGEGGQGAERKTGGGFRDSHGGGGGGKRGGEVAEGIARERERHNYPSCVATVFILWLKLVQFFAFRGRQKKQGMTLL